MNRMSHALGLGLLVVTASAAHAEDLVKGYLCCNIYSDGKEISDKNAAGEEQHRIPLGVPIRVTSFGKHKMKVVVENRDQKFVNDYSRGITMQDLAKRYVVADDPAIKIKSFPKNIQSAIAAAHLVRGMTREQTLMSLGYPTATEVPNLDSNTWTYWLNDRVQYRVRFDNNDLVADVENVLDAKTALFGE